MQGKWDDVIVSEDENIEHSVQHSELVRRINAMLEELPERQRVTLTLIYGLDGNPPLTQREVRAASLLD